MMKSNKRQPDPEELFLTLLQRMQRQYEPTSSVSKDGWYLERPPDEAAAALGKQLALTLQALVEAEEAAHYYDEYEHDSYHYQDVVVPKRLHEKAFLGLSNRHVNPAVATSFYATLLKLQQLKLASQSQTTTTTTTTRQPQGSSVILMSMEWLASWIVQAEEASSSNNHNHNSINWDFLTATVRAYARYQSQQLQFQILSGQQDHMSMTPQPPQNNTNSIAALYLQLQTSTAKLCVLREFTHVAFLNSNSNHTKALLSPLLAASVLNIRTPISETLLCLEGFWRECWSCLANTSNHSHNDSSDNDTFALQLLEWMTTCCQVFVWGLPLRTQETEEIVAGKELAVRWCAQLIELASCCGGGVVDEHEHEDDNHGPPNRNLQLSAWLERLLTEVIPSIAAIVPSYRIAWEPLLVQVQESLLILSPTLQFSPVALFRLAALTMTHPMATDRRAWLSVLLEGITTANSNSNSNHQDSAACSLDSVVLQGMLRGVASLYLRDSTCSATASELLKVLGGATANHHPNHNGIPRLRNKRTVGKDNHLLQLIMENNDSSNSTSNDLVHFLAHPDTFAETRLSAAQQTGALLLGLGLLEQQQQRQQDNNDVAYTYFKHLLDAYPHLGISVLPILVDAMNAAAHVGDGTTLMKQLDFLCTAVVGDKQCAREIWNLVGVELMKPSNSNSIRAAVIRLYPQLCAAHKKLYKRIMEAMGASLQHTTNNDNMEIKLAVAMSLADLTRDDRVRDVTDVIGLIQGLIVDAGWVDSRKRSTHDREANNGNAALVHYAILCLHHLVVAQELDFPLVLVVLNKRLCNIHSIRDLSKLPLVVIEALCILLGDGEAEISTTDDDEEDVPPTLSPQVRKSVETLINLAHSDILRPAGARVMDEIERASIARCRKNIYESLSKYSMDTLGVDEEGIRAVVHSMDDPEAAPKVPPTGIRYASMRQVIEDGIIELAIHSADSNWSSHDHAPVAQKTTKEPTPPPIVTLASNFLKFEEEVLGSGLWVKRGGKGGNKQKNARRLERLNPQVAPALIQALPSPATVQQKYHEERTTATALAALTCFEGKPLSLLEDLAVDIVVNEEESSTDPLRLLFTLQAWMTAAKRVLTELVLVRPDARGLEELLSNIRAWRYRLEVPDNMLLMLATLAVNIPKYLGSSSEFVSCVKDISEEVLEAFNEFENPDLAKLSLGLIGVVSIQESRLRQTEDIVEMLENSVTAYGGESSFGAYYGLALIAQALHLLISGQGPKAKGLKTALMLIPRIVGFLVSEVVTCIEGDHRALASLVDCIQKGQISADIVDALTTLRKKSLNLRASKKTAARSLFMSFAVCLPALTSVNDELLLGVFCLLESLEWGSGKGMALPSCLMACRQCGLFDNREIERIYGKYAKVFEKGMDQGAEGLDDIFYAVTATMSKAVPYSIRRFLVGNRTLFDDHGRAISVLAAVVSVSSLPILGCAASNFSENPRLASSTATLEDIRGVSELLAEGSIGGQGHSIYSDVSVVLMGLMASMRTADNDSDDAASRYQKRQQSIEFSVMRSTEQGTSSLPSAQKGTVLEIIISLLSDKYHDPSVTSDHASQVTTAELLCCLEVLSLPGNFANLLEQLLNGSSDMKTACIRLIVSQIRGRRRAVFDGRDYLDMALRIARTPATSLKSLLGDGDAPNLFIEALPFFLSKFPPDSIEEVVENLWRVCINSQSQAWTINFLQSMHSILGKEKSSMSAQVLNFSRNFVLTRVFAGIRDSPASASQPSAFSSQESIIDKYAKCLVEMPVTSLMDAEFFSARDLDGFVGEALRNQCTMSLVSSGYFTNPSRASSEISSAIVWFSRQLISSEDEIFSSALLQVACSIVEATSIENADRRREILSSLLDNLLLTGPAASYVGLQMLGALVGFWCSRGKDDGQLSMACLCFGGIKRWQSLSPPSLQKLFRLLVNDLPSNLSTYCRRERLCGVIFNRLWRIYTRWLEQGTDQVTIDCMRKALICCRSSDSGEEEFTLVATAMLQC